MEKNISVVPVEVHLYCDECGTEMDFLGQVLMSNPPQYPHVCPKCGSQRIMDAQYPRITYQRKLPVSSVFKNNFFNIYNKYLNF